MANGIPAAGWSATGRIVIATALAGTLDILAATALTMLDGGDPLGMLRFIASGLVPSARGWGLAGSLLGLATHFALIAVMATLYILAADRLPALKRQPAIWGVLYGLAIYAVMSWIVLPLRFGAPFPSDPVSIAAMTFCHTMLVGLPIALAARR